MMPAATPAAGVVRSTALENLRPATRLAAGLLAILSCYLVPPWLLVPAALAVIWLLAASGCAPLILLRTLRPLAPVALLVIILHVFTTTEAAPLGRPSWTGLGHGLIAICRVVLSLACLVLWQRALGLSELIAGIGWWLGPLRGRGVDPARIGVVLTVATGAVTRALAESRRIEAVQRLRRSWQPLDGAEATGGDAGVGSTSPDQARRERPGWWRRTLDRAYIVTPLVEGIFRRGDALALALAGRTMRPQEAPAGPRRLEAVGLVLWITGLVVTTV